MAASDGCPGQTDWRRLVVSADQHTSSEPPITIMNMTAKFALGLIVEANTAQHEVYKSLLENICGTGLSPNYAGRNIADKRPFNIELETSRVTKMAATFRYLNDYVRLFRTRSPKYEAHITVSVHTTNELTFESNCQTANVPTLLRLIEDLASQHTTVLAYLNRVWSAEEAPALTEHERNEASGLGADSPESLYRTGPSGIAMISWFGPLLVEKIGRARLLSIGATEGPTPSMLRVALSSTPWQMDALSVLTRKRELLSSLRPCGAFAVIDYSLDLRNIYANRKPGPTWTRPPWRMHRNDFQ